MCIFARQLYAVLVRHNRHLGSLFAVRVGDRHIPPRQIQRLKRAAAGDCSVSVTLNPDEIESITQAFSLDADDIRRLRGALLAESVYRFLLDRVERDSALAIAEHFLQVLFSTNPAQLAEWSESAMDGTRNLPEDESTPMSQHDWEIEHELQPAVELYEEALLWISHARAARDGARQRAYAVLAVTLLSDANELLDNFTGIIGDTQDLEDYRQLIAHALEVARAMAT